MLAIQKHRRLLGEAVGAKRKRAGFSQVKLAEKADLDTVFYRRFAHYVGAGISSMRSLIRISKHCAPFAVYLP